MVRTDADDDHVPVLHGERSTFSTTVVQAGDPGLDPLRDGGLLENDFVLRAAPCSSVRCARARSGTTPWCCRAGW